MTEPEPATMTEPARATMTELELATIYRSIPNDRTCRDCHECAIRCSGDITLCEFEWRAIAEYIDRYIPRKFLSRILTEDKTFEIADRITEEFCILYDMLTRRCAIYPVRPLVCRLLGHVEFMPCPIARVPEIIPEGHRIMQRYAELPLKTFAEWFRIVPCRALAIALEGEEEGPPCRL